MLIFTNFLRNFFLNLEEQIIILINWHFLNLLIFYNIFKKFIKTQINQVINLCFSDLYIINF